MSEPVAENSLVNAAVAGDIAALEKLLLRHFPALERHVEPRIPNDARRHLSTEDVLQDVFVQVFRDINQLQSAPTFLFSPGSRQLQIIDLLMRLNASVARSVEVIVISFAHLTWLQQARSKRSLT